MNRLAVVLSRLVYNISGTAVTEFALSAPLLMAAGLWGVETANQAIVQMRINQIAVLVADNSARIGENSLLGEARIYESDVNDVLYGAHVQGGDAFDFYANGRVILSSLEVVPGTEDQQYIHWQRCMGTLRTESSYGYAGDGLDGRLAGMGPTGEEIIAYKGEAGDVRRGPLCLPAADIERLHQRAVRSRRLPRSTCARTAIWQMSTSATPPRPIGWRAAASSTGLPTTTPDQR